MFIFFIGLGVLLLAIIILLIVIFEDYKKKALREWLIENILLIETRLNILEKKHKNSKKISK